MSTPAPKKGETFSGVVRDLASDGRGIVSHPNGLTVFVAGVWADEEVRLRFTGLDRRVGTAEAIEIIKASPHRINPPCPYQGFSSGDCGGCPWQFIRYEEQLRVKQSRIEKAFARLGFNSVNSIWPSPQAFNYRNRAQLKSNGEVIGYVSAGSHTLAAIEDCLVLSEPNRDTLRTLIHRLPNPEWRPRAREKWRTLNIDESTSADNLRIDERLPFQQSNNAQNEAMREWLREHIRACGIKARALELFCGSGNFTEVLAAEGFESVVAVDGASEAIDELRNKALPGVKALSANLFNDEAIASMLRKEGPFSTLVLDPPRDGLKNKKNLLPKRPLFDDVFYISCDLATLCRDLQEFLNAGYRLREVQGLDQAPHTPHVEVLVHLAKG